MSGAGVVGRGVGEGCIRIMQGREDDMVEKSAGGSELVVGPWR